jgi:hypothetical protein
MCASDEGRRGASTETRAGEGELTGAAGPRTPHHRLPLPPPLPGPDSGSSPLPWAKNDRGAIGLLIKKHRLGRSALV